MDYLRTDSLFLPLLQASRYSRYTWLDFHACFGGRSPTVSISKGVGYILVRIGKTVEIRLMIANTSLYSSSSRTGLSTHTLSLSFPPSLQKRRGKQVERTDGRTDGRKTEQTLVGFVSFRPRDGYLFTRVGSHSPVLEVVTSNIAKLKGVLTESIR